MRDTPAGAAIRRARRKQDLLLASAVARQQAAVAVGQISPRVDAGVNLYVRWRKWTHSPALVPLAAVLGAGGTLLAVRKGRALALLRWGLIAWKLARWAAARQRG